MKTRILTAVPLALVVAAFIWWGPRWLFLLVLLLLVEISLFEYFHLSHAAGMKGIPWLGYLAGAALCLAQTAESGGLKAAIGLTYPPWVSPNSSGGGGLLSAVLLISVFFAALAPLFRGDALKDYLGSASSTVFGILYLGFSLSWFFPLRFSSAYDGRALVLFLLLVNWAGDAFALLIGRTMGRHFFVPNISPRKTVEGSIAGLAGSLLVGWLCSIWFWQTAGLKTAMLLASVAAIAGQIGDLVESALKRAGNLKDSGSLLPGHGGLLDRIDSLVFAVPAVWFVMVLRSKWN